MEATPALGNAELTAFLERVRMASPGAAAVQAPAELNTLLTSLGTVLEPTREQITVVDQEVTALIATAEKLRNALAGLQIRATNTLETLRRAEHRLDHPTEADAPAERQERHTMSAHQSVVLDLGIALKISPSKASDFTRNARKATTQYPDALAHVNSGAMNPTRLDLLLRETTCLTHGDRREVDQALAPDLPLLGDTEARNLIRAACYEIDENVASKRWNEAHEHRYVTLRPDEDGTMTLTGTLPQTEGIAIETGLRAHAARMKRNGDPRPLAHIKADTLTEALLKHLTELNGTTVTNVGARPEHSPEPTTQQDTTRDTAPRLEIQLVITDTTLFRNGTEPAHWVGHGPVPADAARHLIKDAIAAELDHQEQAFKGTPWAPIVTLLRVWQDPDTKNLVAMESKARTFPPGLAHFIRTRDDTCQGPYCGAPIRDIDHIHPHHQGGPTTADNAQGLCRHCNLTKELDHVITIHHEDGSTQTITPGGQTHTTPPDPATRHWHRQRNATHRAQRAQTRDTALAQRREQRILHHDNPHQLRHFHPGEPWSPRDDSPRSED